MKKVMFMFISLLTVLGVCSCNDNEVIEPVVSDSVSDMEVLSRFVDVNEITNEYYINENKKTRALSYVTGSDWQDLEKVSPLSIEKYKNNKVWTAVLNDADQGYPYIKRFAFEPTTKKLSFIGENAASELLLLSDNKYPRFQVTFGGADSVREPLIIDAEEYIGEKSYKAKGKRVTTFEVDNIKEIEPREVPEEELEEPEIIEETVEEEQINQNDVRDELTGQMRLFDNEELK